MVVDGEASRLLAALVHAQKGMNVLEHRLDSVEEEAVLKEVS